MSKKSIFSYFFKYAELIVNARVAYNNAKADPELKAEVKTFGKRSIVYTLLATLFTLGGGALLAYACSIFVSAKVFLSIILIIMSLPVIAMGLLYFPLALNLLIKQLKLNKKAVGWVALVLYLLAFFGCIALLILFFHLI